MANEVDDEWADLLGDDASGPAPAVAPKPATVNKTVRAPAVTPAMTQRAAAVGPVPTVKRTQRAPVVSPAPRPAKAAPVPTPPRKASESGPDHAAAEVGAPRRRSPTESVAVVEMQVAEDAGPEDSSPSRPSMRVGRQTASVVAVSRSTADTIPFQSRPLPMPKARASTTEAAAPSTAPRNATRRLVVRPPPGSDGDGDGIPITVEDGLGEVPAVPTWAGDGESNPMAVETVTVPEPSDVIDVGLSPALDPSANLKIEPMPVVLQEPASVDPGDSADGLRVEPPKVDAADSSSSEPISIRDSELISVKPVAVEPPAVPKPVEESTSVPALDEIAKATVAEEEAAAISSRESVPHFGGLNDVAPARSARASSSSSGRAYVPQMAEPMVGGDGKSLMPWLLGVAAVAVLATLGWMALAPGDDKPAVAAADKTNKEPAAQPEATKAAARAAVEPTPAKEPAPTENDADEAAATGSADAVPAVAGSDGEAVAESDGGQPSAEDSGGAAAEGGDDGAVPELAAEDPDEPTVEPTDEPAAEDPPKPAPSGTVDVSDGAPAIDPGAAERYDKAAALYAETPSQELLETMALAACAMDDGVKARSAFRKLKGGDVRKRVMIACRRSSVDLTAKGDDPTPAALVRAARRALAAGDHAKALELARKSNRIERSQDAVFVTALAACAAGDLEKAISTRRHLGKARKKQLAERCPGIEPD
ncbi:MAG: hypothetical protein AAF721_21775 [Myxococcota bacterium]